MPAVKNAFTTTKLIHLPIGQLLLATAIKSTWLINKMCLLLESMKEKDLLCLITSRKEGTPFQEIPTEVSSMKKKLSKFLALASTKMTRILSSPISNTVSGPNTSPFSKKISMSSALVSTRLLK
jgi:hypothetical protein